MDVGYAGHYAVASGHAPFVLVRVVLNRVHGLAVCCCGGQETFVFGLELGEVQACHFEGAAFGIPSYSERKGVSIIVLEMKGGSCFRLRLR